MRRIQSSSQIHPQNGWKRLVRKHRKSHWKWSASFVEPCTTDTRFIWTVLFVPTKSSYIFSKINPLYADTGSYGQWTLFCVQVTHSHLLSTPLYGHWLSAHCLFSVSHLCDNCRLYPVQIMTDFYGWIKVYYSIKKKNSNKVAWLIWFWTVCVSSGVWLLYYV